MPVLNFCDYFTAQILLPLGAFVTSILIGWCVSKETVRAEFTNWGTLNVSVFGISLFSIYLFAVRFICPACILAIALHQVGVI
jgi:NSS family neurotransmitter:Na+ symporter